MGIRIISIATAICRVWASSAQCMHHCMQQALSRVQRSCATLLGARCMHCTVHIQPLANVKCCCHCFTFAQDRVPSVATLLPDATSTAASSMAQRLGGSNICHSLQSVWGNRCSSCSIGGNWKHSLAATYGMCNVRAALAHHSSWPDLCACPVCAAQRDVSGALLYAPVIYRKTATRCRWATQQRACWPAACIQPLPLLGISIGMRTFLSSWLWHNGQYSSDCFALVRYQYHRLDRKLK